MSTTRTTAAAALATLLARLLLPAPVRAAGLAWFGPDRLGALLADAEGAGPRRLALDDLADSAALRGIELLVLADAERWPAAATAPLAEFLARDGRLIVIGANPFTTLVERGPDGSWRDVADVDSAAAAPDIELISPSYRTFEFPAAAAVRASVRSDQAWLDTNARLEWVAPPARLRCPIWRARGLSGTPDPRGRFVPLIDLEAELPGQGVARGTAVAAYVAHSDGEARGVWAWWALPLDAWGAPGDRLLRELAAALLAPAHLLHAGPLVPAIFTDQSASFGGAILRHPAKGASAPADNLTWTLDWGGGDGARVRTGSLVGTDFTAGPVRVPAGRHDVSCQLRLGDRVIDRIQSSLIVVPETGPEASGPRVTVGSVAGDAPGLRRFVRGGARWFPNGVNYWPLSSGGAAPTDPRTDWRAPFGFDPEILRRDLAQMRDLGMNLVSVQYTHPRQGPVMTALLALAEELGLQVNLFLAGCHPLDTDRDLYRDLLWSIRPWLWDSLFALDLAWEPHLGPRVQRQKWDADWTRWLAEQYGTAEAAEDGWGCPLERRAGGLVAGPTDTQILEDGAWRPMVAAYRRFLDDLIGRRLGAITRDLRRIEAGPLLSFRAGYGGTGRAWIDAQMPFDLASGAGHLDFVSPEGYGLPADSAAALDAGIVSAYARWAGNGAPVFWAEFGTSVHPVNSERLEEQRRVWEAMYHVIARSDADGAAGWWWPGGYRLDEKSDFGIIEPSGLPRPAARAAGPGMVSVLRQAPEREAVEVQFDRALHPRGFSQVWERHRAEYLAALGAGRKVRLVTEATGRASPQIALRSLAGGPWRPGCPPRDLNAEAARIDVNGVPCEPGRLRRIESAGGAPILVRPRFHNSGEVKWVAAGEGRVCVAVESRVAQGGVAARASLPFEADVPRYATGAAQEFSPGPEAKGQEIMLRMRCELERGENAAPVPFGQAWSASAAFGLGDFGADPAGEPGILQLGQYRVIERRPLAGGTQHVQGLAMAPGRVWVSSVDLDRRGGRIAAYPEMGGPPLAETLLGDGELVHPGGMQWADGRIWVPLAAYRPSGPSRILALDAATLRVESAFAVGDHIGAVAADAGAGRLFGVNWDARQFYVWDMTGAMLARIDAPTAAAYQDLHYDPETRLLWAVGHEAGGAVLDAIDPGSWDVRRRLALVAAGGAPAPRLGREGMALARGRFFLVPEDGPGSELLVLGPP